MPHQWRYEISTTFQDDFNANILDNWFAIDKTGEPSRANQIVLGYEQFIGSGLKLQIEGYYKNITDMLTYEERRATTDGEVSSESLVDLLTPADGYAYGAEFFMQQSVGKLTGWAGYSWSVSRKKMNEKEYYTNWDRTHVFNVLANYIYNNNWEFNLKFTLQSGQAFTPINGYFLENLPGESQVGYRTIPATRNGGRFPSYHRLDLGAVWHRKKYDLFFQRFYPQTFLHVLYFLIKRKLKVPLQIFFHFWLKQLLQKSLFFVAILLNQGI